MRKQHILNTFKKKEERKWDTLYWMVDIHDTCIKANYKANDIPTVFFPGAKEALQRISNRTDCCLIMWTCSYPHEIEQYLKLFKDNGINFKYVNCNPEPKDTAFGYFKEKFYTNFILDDKADFLPGDWKNINDALDVLDGKTNFISKFFDMIADKIDQLGNYLQRHNAAKSQYNKINKNK